MYNNIQKSSNGHQTAVDYKWFGEVLKFCLYLVICRRSIINCIWLVILVLPQKCMNGSHVPGLSSFVQPQKFTDHLSAKKGHKALKIIHVFRAKPTHGNTVKVLLISPECIGNYHHMTLFLLKLSYDCPLNKFISWSLTRAHSCKRPALISTTLMKSKGCCL